MTDKTVEPVRKQVLVDIPQSQAFTAFTENIDAWYPREYRVGPSPLKKAVLETQVNGQFYGIGEDGTRGDWATVLVWEPPNRILFAWHINASFQLDPSFVTEVEISFVPEGKDRTRVTLEHRNLEKFGENAETIRKRLDSDGAWAFQLKKFGLFINKA
jgi:hypothetical protein